MPDIKVLYIYEKKSEELVEKIKNILAHLRNYKPEFTSLTFKEFELPHNTPLDKRTLKFNEYDLCLCDEELINMIIDGVPEAVVPLIIFAEEYSSEFIEILESMSYPFISGVFKKKGVSEDVVDQGKLAGIIKNCLREHLVRKGKKISKKIGWCYKGLNAEEEYRKRKFISLFLSPPMRLFLQQLKFSIDNLKEEAKKLPQIPEHTKPDKLRALFTDIGKKNVAETSKRLQELFSPESPKLPVHFSHLLLEGETGTGKTLIAELIGKWVGKESSKNEQLIRVSTVNIGKELLETELFGSIEGAFTGATSRPGKIPLAYGRFVFLDEIGDMPIELQSKLLMFLDSLTLYPDGWPYSKPIYAPVHVIAATNRPLKEYMTEGKFREDLYHRFKYKFTIPPLRDRREDMRLLIDFTLQNPNVNMKSKIKELTLEAITKLESYAFPGNFRELEDVLTKAVFNATRAKRTYIESQDIEF